MTDNVFFAVQITAETLPISRRLTARRTCTLVD